MTDEKIIDNYPEDLKDTMTYRRLLNIAREALLDGATDVEITEQGAVLQKQNYRVE